MLAYGYVLMNIIDFALKMTASKKIEGLLGGNSQAVCYLTNAA
jgi:hypothetical protein